MYMSTTTPAPAWKVGSTEPSRRCVVGITQLASGGMARYTRYCPGMALRMLMRCGPSKPPMPCVCSYRSTLTTVSVSRVDSLYHEICPTSRPAYARAIDLGSPTGRCAASTHPASIPIGITTRSSDAGLRPHRTAAYR